MRVMMNGAGQTGWSLQAAKMSCASASIALALVACSKPGANAGGGSNATSPSAPAPAVAPSLSAPSPTAPSPAAPGPASVGFDSNTAPMGTAPTGAWPYFSLIDGYEPLSIKNKPGDASREFERDVAFDRYEFFDGKKLIPVEGRLYTVRALGAGASIFQAEKTYEKLIHDLGGVTVWTGSGQEMLDAKLKFSDPRHRGIYNYDGEKGGVYMVRTATGEIWVEVWKRWQDNDDSYWLTVVEKKGLQMKAKMLDAEQMKAALDANGHVALYLNFDTDATAIRPDSLPVVGEVLKLLSANPSLNLEVQGHTDNSGTPQHNQILSEGRAKSVVAALTSQGISAGRLTAKGYGQIKPIADNSTEDGKAKNRRVELVKR